MIEDVIYGYGIYLPDLIKKLDGSTKVNDLNIKFLSDLLVNKDQLENAVDNANTDLSENNQPPLKLAHQEDIIDDTDYYLYYPSVMPYAKTYDKNTLTKNIKHAITNILWSEYSAPMTTGYYPIKEEDYIKQTLDSIPDDLIKDLNEDIDWY